ncbi:type II toxin-antitoxin system VapC family toxin [Aetokthonos hydrillicola Thurmond2011]|jgi:PIN domain nuclease of toxin-antitoxin system|uniref:Type II toxin-antitoxin system VapC family toxin n=1 Tax=Aetokthonos hydrillicola Thurmond2011 TaxID=2712845 RepID=A0AAP5IG21_9CYAN|nr:type II toxin-antitoxin system VapC family toxin [Aetokthonos hydrillicola]MDR9900955.1 type II toxin-antitoxin system VapC family toxin [Aetokthonos hydrillicola Thurmond2011]
MKPYFVLDASALLAWFFQEPGASAVTHALRKGVAVSSINWAETLQKLLGHGVTPDQVHTDLKEKQILNKALVIQPFTATDAEAVAFLQAETKVSGLSLADRACLALAHRFGVPALTADRIWSTLTIPNLQIEVIR